jgi:hypothetical protein
MWVRRASSAISANHRQGRLIVATFAGRSLMRIEKNGKRTVLADRYRRQASELPKRCVVKRMARSTSQTVMEASGSTVQVVPDDTLAHVSPLKWEHINLTGDYHWRKDAGL